jgi:hypothetical protein
MKYIFNVVFLLLSLSIYQVYAATDCTKADASGVIATCRPLPESSVTPAIQVYNPISGIGGNITIVTPPNIFSVSTTNIGNGSGSITGAGNYIVRSNVTLTATPDSNSTFIGWTPKLCATSFTMPNNALTCIANFALKTYRITKSYQPSEGGSVTCTPPDNILHGSNSVCTATANAGYVFADFKGDCSGTNCVLNNVTSNKNVVANFEPKKYSVMMTVNPTGGGSLNCNPNPINHGNNSICTVIANAGYTLTSFNGDCGGTSCILNNITSDKNVVANLSLKNYSVTTTVNPLEGGSIRCNPNPVNHGSDSICSVTANTGYVFTNFSNDCIGANCTLSNVTSNKNTSANFALKKYSIAAITDGKGKIEPASLQLEYGNPAPFRLSPDTGYELDTVTGCGSGTISPQRNSYTIPPISENCQISATFKRKTYKVEISVVPEGSGSVGIPSPIDIKHGEGATFLVTPASGYEIGGVNGCSPDAPSQGNMYTKSPITDNCNITVNFIAKGQISISTVVPQENGSIDPQGKSLDKGESAKFTLIPKIGYEIDTVSGCNGSRDISNNTFTTGKLDDNCQIVASFKAKLYTVSTRVKTDKGGSISPANAQIEYGKSTTFTLIPFTGYEIDREGVDGCSGYLQDAQFTTGLIDANCEVTASFKPIQWAVTGFTNGKGSISPVSQNISNGQQAQFNLMPNTGYEVENVTSNCTGVRSDSIYIINQVTANCSVTVSFKPKSYTIQTNIRPPKAGFIKLTSNSIENGNKIEFSVNPIDGYYVELVRGCKGETILPSNGVYITNPVTEDACILQADFISQKHQIKLTYQYLNGSSRVAYLDAIEHGTSTGFDIPPSEKVDNIIGCGGRLENNHYTTGVITAPCEIVVYYNNSNISQCTTFNLLMRPQVYVACVKVGDAVYEAGMNMISASPKMRFEVDMSTLKNTSLIPNQQCAIFPAPNTANRLKLNCLDLINSRYWVEMSLVDNPDAIQFDLIDFAEN